MLSKLSKVAALFVLAITLISPLPVFSKSIPISVEIDIGRKKFNCTRAGVCSIRLGTEVPIGSSRTVKGTAEVKGRQMAISFGSALPEKGDVLTIDEDITLDQEVANRLGFKTVVVLKGTYQINRRANKFGTLSLNVRTK